MYCYRSIYNKVNYIAYCGTDLFSAERIVTSVKAVLFPFIKTYVVVNKLFVLGSQHEKMLHGQYSHSIQTHVIIV